MAITRQAAAADDFSCAGPLDYCIKDFAAQLSRQGYVPDTVRAGLDPVSWTSDPYGTRSPLCPEVMPRTRRNSERR
jgi:hypothetical protein